MTLKLFGFYNVKEGLLLACGLRTHQSSLTTFARSYSVEPPTTRRVHTIVSSLAHILALSRWQRRSLVVGPAICPYFLSVETGSQSTPSSSN